MSADGSHAGRLAAAGVPMSRPTWSPDSRRIGFADEKGRISIINADGSNLRTPTTPGWDPDWSPDGSRFVFAGSARGPGIYIVKVDSTNLRKLTPVRGWQGPSTPDWSPDARRIVFMDAVAFPGRAGGTASNDEVWVMNADGSSRVRLTRNHVPDREPVWSPDDAKIAFVGAYSGAGSSEIYTMNADGSGFARLTHNHVTEGSPSWQPVASRLAP